jgi:hypothetical protein
MSPFHPNVDIELSVTIRANRKRALRRFVARNRRSPATRIRSVYRRIAGVRGSMSANHCIPDLAPKGAEGRFMTQTGTSRLRSSMTATRTKLPLDHSDALRLSVVHPYHLDRSTIDHQHELLSLPLGRVFGYRAILRAPCFQTLSGPNTLRLRYVSHPYATGPPRKADHIP